MDLENQVETTATGTTDAPAESAAPAITDIDGISEFTFQGEKFTPDQLHKLMNEHKTFASQAEAYNKSKQFEENLDIDLENVLNDPTKYDKFKQTYPKAYHAVLDRFLQNNRPQSAQANNAQPALPKEFMQKFGHMEERLRFHEQRALDAEIANANAKIDTILPTVLKKYPMAIEDQILGRAEAILQSGQKLTDQTWERLARESHTAMQKRADQYYGAKLKEQKEKGQRGADTGPGGGTPGQAPAKPRSFDEAREAMIASLKSQKNG
jgi:hypothetical protein